MKLVFKIVLLVFVLSQMLVYGQKISDDSLMKKARLEIFNNPDNAINIGKNLLKKEKNIDESISILMLLSTANIAKRNFDESLKYILKAKELAQKTIDPKVHARVLVSVAIQYQQMELFSKSLETLNEADEYLAKLPEILPEKHIETARSYAIRGMIYKSQSNPEIALEKFLKSVKSFEKVSQKKTVFCNLSVVYYNIGYCYLNLNQIDKAEQAFLQSIDFAQKNDAKSLEAFALKGMAEVYKGKRENLLALNFLEKAANLCKNTGDIVLNEGIFKEMADNYLATGNQNLYQLYNRKYFEMRFQREQNELTSINQAIDNHNKETLLKSKELKTQYRYLFFLILAFGAIIISFFLYFIFKIKRENRKYQNEIQQMIRS